MVDSLFGYAFDRQANVKVLLVCPFSSKQGEWFDMECVNIHNGKKYKMLDFTKERNPPSDVVFPSQFARLLAEYQRHPEAGALALMRRKLSSNTPSFRTLYLRWSCRNRKGANHIAPSLTLIALRFHRSFPNHFMRLPTLVPQPATIWLPLVSKI